MKYCLPIIKNSVNEVKETINRYPDYEIYEVWLDYIENFVIPSDPPAGGESRNLTHEITLLRQIPPRATLGRDDINLILCFRRKNGEPIKMSFEKRKKFIANSIGKHVLIDCDIEQQKEDLEYINSLPANRQRILVSYHNYKETPDQQGLENIINRMEKYNPEIYKIATFCNNIEDAVRLMQLLIQLKKQNKKAIVLGMGDYGKITRIFGAMYGNELTFTPENGEVSAPGQITREKLRLMIKD